MTQPSKCQYLSYFDRSQSDYKNNCLIMFLSFHFSSLWNDVMALNILRPRQNGHHFTDDISKCIFLNENGQISIKIPLKFVPKVPINNIPALVQIMAWCRTGHKPLSEPMTVSLLTHICITRPQWVNSMQPSDALWWHRSGSTLVQVMACCLMAPSHCLNQCWLIISVILWYSPECNFIGNAQNINP